MVLDEPVLVYNLEVEDFHSFFVGCVPVLVHNIIIDLKITLLKAQAGGGHLEKLKG